MKAKVYIVANTGHDYSKAEDRGELRFIFDGKVNVFASDKMCQDITEALADSGPEDFLITSGNALAACVAFNVLMEKHGKVNSLIYSYKNELYEVRTIRRKQLVAPVAG